MDLEVPVAVCPSSVVVPAEHGRCDAVVYYGSVGATDNCGNVSVALQSGLETANGSRFAVGTTSVRFRAVDTFGLWSDCVFNVTVQDNELAVIESCPSSIAVGTDAGLCGAVVVYNVSIQDNCQASMLVNRTHGLSSGSFFGVGSTLVRHVGKDIGGSIVECSFNVSVADIEQPSLSCSGNLTFNSSVGVCTSNIGYSAPVWNDNCAGANLTRLKGPSSPTVLSVGIAEVSFAVVDTSGNENHCTFFCECPRSTNTSSRLLRSSGG